MNIDVFVERVRNNSTGKERIQLDPSFFFVSCGFISHYLSKK